MFALKKNQTEFRGRALRVYPSTENPQQGRLILHKRCIILDKLEVHEVDLRYM